MASVHQEIDPLQQGDKEVSVVCEHETTPAVAGLHKVQNRKMPFIVMAPRKPDGSYTTKFGFDVHKIKGSLSAEVYAVVHLVQVKN